MKGESLELWLFYLIMIAIDINSSSYWNDYAKWYKLWREHNRYHEPIKMILLNIVDENMKILDIGAGDGVLSFPLVTKGCIVTALEPSESMHKFIHDNNKIYNRKLKIDTRRFEKLNPSEISQFDFALACNSLHLTENGIEKSIFKLFNSGIENVFLVTEKIFSLDLLSRLYPEYKIHFSYSYICESLFAYHSLEEVFEHWEFKLKRELFSLDNLFIF
ncbi:MAG: class I SAM-dependent methyltransferase [Thermodesulfovibrio sp.]|nr:class I SAM-dependent methyltransferase [Thermodesulfovibrio sp.]MDW7973439.1 class I SAM-dependent methyltransferase [Thermodesulfovibrio sp.]